MLNFELSMIGVDAGIKDAIAETIESKTSGVLVRTRVGDLRLLRFDRLVEAENAGLESLEQVNFDPVVEVEGVSDFQVEDVVRSAGLVFAFLGLSGRMARLFSLSEGKGGPYASPSSGGRCHRPGKPPNVSARNWYHYYSVIPNPNICTFDSSPIS